MAVLVRTETIAVPRFRFVVLTVIMVGLATRLVLLRTPFHGYDSFAYSHWTWRLLHEPLDRFYVDDGQAYPDHLPGDLWLLKLVGHTARFLDPGISFYGPAYSVSLALMVVVFDAATVAAIWRVGVQFGPPDRAARYALAYWLAPAPIFVASVWGQTDGISCALAVIALVLGTSGRYSRAMLVLSFCVMVKPQYGLLLLPLLVGWWRLDAPDWRSWLSRVMLTGVACLGFVAVIAAPFQVSLAGGWGQWSLFQRLQLANVLYPVSTLGAHNIWIIFDPFTWPPDDRVPWLLGVNRQSIGIALFAVIVVISLWVLWRCWRGPITMILTANILMSGFFLVMTRMHERYAFPLAALSILLAAVHGRYKWYAITMNLLVFANISLRFYWPGNDDAGWMRLVNNAVIKSSGTVYILVGLTCVVFMWLIWDAIKESP